MVKGKRNPYRYPDKGHRKVWAYERFKADLQDIPLTPEEYEERIKEWCEKKQILTGGHMAKTESQLLREIMRAVYPYIRIHRANVGSVVTKSGRRFSTGLPKGFPDLFGYRRSDGKAVFIECKLKYNKPSEEQQRYINEAADAGAIAGICYCIEDALRLIQEQRGVQ